MTTVIIIALYFLNIHISRYYNIKLIRIDKTYSVYTLIWFIPILGFVSILLTYYYERVQQIEFK